MGISTLQSYHGAQIFEALGISKSVVDKYFTGTVTRIQGLTIDDIAKEVLVRHRLGYPTREIPIQMLDVGGVYQWKQRGEKHLFNPETISLLQQSTRNKDFAQFKEYASTVDAQGMMLQRYVANWLSSRILQAQYLCQKLSLLKAS